jgi:hypothetical protein
MKPHRFVLPALIGLCLSFSQGARGAGVPSDEKVAHGTVNIVLANPNGFVVLTDSMANAGGVPSKEPAQKLFRIDDRTVCAVAGFLFAAAPTAELSTNTAAIIRLFSKELATEAPRTIEQKLDQLAFIFSVRIPVLADFREAIGDTDKVHDYAMVLTMAGYDTDGLPKIGQATLLVAAVDGRFESSTQEVKMIVLSDHFEYQAAGMPEIADQFLENPDLDPQDPVLSEYAASLRQDKGRSLTLDQLRSLAVDLRDRTAHAYPQNVGGQNQIAVLADGRIQSLDQLSFRDTPRAIAGFGLLEQVGFDGEGSWARSGAVVCVACSIGHMRFAFDESYLLRSVFTKAILTYDGGPTYVDESNRFDDCVLVLGPNAKFPSLLVHDLVVNFPWSRVHTARTIVQSKAH